MSSKDVHWVKNLPYSKMVFPNTFSDRTKYIFWWLYTPCHPYIRDILLALRIVRHEGRQDFLLGKIAPHLTIKEFTHIIIERGYGNHFVAWKDEGELVSLRYVENFAFQYHLRVFEDREVRAHYEHTPECFPISHIKQINMEDRRRDFLKILGDTIVNQ
ncbi:MAG: hypothetical protein ABI430_03900 [Candidatus Taylorbacteria bacterium]